MQNDISILLNEAAMLMAVGMGVVFLFLIMLIGAVNLIAAICARFPDAEIAVIPVRQSIQNHSPASATITAAIAAAIHQHRKGQ